MTERLSEKPPPASSCFYVVLIGQHPTAVALFMRRGRLRPGTARS